MAFLEAQLVRVRYGGADVLHGLDLEAERGTLTALLGASGSGKTTLLRAIAGFVPIAAGRIVLDGQDISRLPPEKRRMAMVFQSYALWPHMTVAQNIGYGLKLRRVGAAEIAQRVEALLAMLPLGGSGGRRRSSRGRASPVSGARWPPRSRPASGRASRWVARWRSSRSACSPRSRS